MIFAHLFQTVSNPPTNVSALESSISVLERAISALESEVKALEIRSVPWEHSVWIFTLLVVVGVALELWVIQHDWRDEMEAWALGYFGIIRLPGRPSLRKLRIEIASVLLITLGVAGELVIGIQTSSINGKLRGKSTELRSKSADLRSQSDQLVALITQEAAQLRKDAEQLKSDNLKLEALIQPRDLSPEQRDAIQNALQAFSGKFVLVLASPDPETIRFAELIGFAINSKRKIPVQFGPLQEGFTMPPRTGVEVTGTDQEFVSALKHALFSIGHVEPAPPLTQPRHSFGGLMLGAVTPKTPDATVYVGLKPLKFSQSNR